MGYLMSCLQFASIVLLPERILFFCEEVFSPTHPYAGTPAGWSFLVAAPLRCSLSDISLAEADRRRIHCGLSPLFRPKHSTELKSKPSVSSVISCSNIHGFIPSGRFLRTGRRLVPGGQPTPESIARDPGWKTSNSESKLFSESVRNQSDR
jgi:hypothetical protein